LRPESNLDQVHNYSSAPPLVTSDLDFSFQLLLSSQISPSPNSSFDKSQNGTLLKAENEPTPTAFLQATPISSNIIQFN
jgi:hypothetical protein